MGSFDAVCGLSNMAIGDGDPVVAMLIRRSPRPSYQQSPIYPYSIWQPATVLIRTEYADYGGVSLTDEQRQAWELTQKAALVWSERRWIEATPTNEGRWHYFSIKLEKSFDLTGDRPDFADTIDEQPFSMWMAHAGVWDQLISTVKCDYYATPEMRCSMVPVKDVVEKVISRNEEIMAGDVPERFRGHNFPRYMINRDIWGIQPTDYSSVTDRIYENISDVYESGDFDRFKVLVNHWKNSLMLSTLLYEMRRLLIAPGTIGHQHGHDQPLLMLADAIRDQAAKNKTKYGDYDEDEDEDEDGE